MSDDVSLFGDDPVVPPTQVSARAPIADWQVDLLRNVLEARGLTSMSERQRTIEAAAGRSVESLRALTHDEAMRVLNRLGEHGGAASGRTTSQWDDRDEDTWIDRL